MAAATLTLILALSLAGCTGETLVAYYDAGSDASGLDGAPDSGGDLAAVDSGPTPDLADLSVADTSLDSKTCVSGWQKQTTSTSATLNAVWGASASMVFAVGDQGTVLVKQGYAWTPVPLAKSKSGVIYRGVWGTSSKNVFIVGSYKATSTTRNGLILRFDGSKWTESVLTRTGNLDLRTIGAKGKTEVQVLGSESSGTGYKPTIAIFNGASWTISNIVSTAEAGQINHLWNSSATTTHAVGGACKSGTCSPLYYLYNSGTWIKDTLSTKPPQGVIKGIWGTGTTNIFMVGLYTAASGSTTTEWASVSAFKGSTWTTTYLDKGYGLNAVWGDGQNSVYAVGSKGKILRNAAGGWSAMKSGVINTLHGVWGSGAKDVYAVGEGGTILHMCSPF